MIQGKGVTTLERFVAMKTEENTLVSAVTN